MIPVVVASSSVAVVTDSTAYLPETVTDKYGIRVIPLHVVVSGVSGREGIEVTPADVARALQYRHLRVTTSRPSPMEFAEVYAELLDAGVSGVVSIHLSAHLSSTYDSAVTAAVGFGDQVAVVDARSTGMGLGFPVLAAAQAAQEGGDLDQVRRAAEQAAARTTALFYVDSLEYLRRGGRISAAEALVGTALSVKPILHVADGRVVVKERVRTTSRALARLEELAVHAAGGDEVDIAVHYLQNPERAAAFGERLTARLSKVRHLYTCEVGAAVAAHVGPGLLGVVVSRV